MLAAPIAGSFFGVLIRRLPEGRPVGLARSECESCHRKLSPVELVPLVSYLGARGRCQSCGAAIGAFHPAIELAAVAVALSAVIAELLGSAPDPDRLWAGCFLGWTLLALAWIDAEHMVLPDVLTLPLIPAGLLAASLIDPAALTERAIGALAGFAALWAVAEAYWRLRGQEGLGQGDAKLLAAGGAWLGWDQLPWVVLIAACAGIAWALIQRARGADMTATTALPFGPPLALAIWAVWLYLTVSPACCAGPD